ncbi:hypothetical protein HK098_004019 [Nowakowskiella sp. JEL0407]|nr:hypothetical protein HK098_004019 [Nowakowskiella sp. JEL0407]
MNSIADSLRSRSASPSRKNTLKDSLEIPLVSLSTRNNLLNNTNPFEFNDDAFEEPPLSNYKATSRKVSENFYGYVDEPDDLEESHLIDEELNNLAEGRTPLSVVSLFSKKRSSKLSRNRGQYGLLEESTFMGESLPEAEFLNLISHQNNLDDVLEMVRMRMDFLRENDDASKLNRLPFWKLASYRLPAIILTIIFELCVGLVISKFSETMSKHLLIASFMPVLSAISGNIGLQASATTLRALATGHASQTGFLGIVKVLVKELGSAVTIAILSGTTLAIIGSSWAQSQSFGIVTGSSVLISSSLAGSIGSLSPLFFKSLGIDPAVTTGPFETALQDMIGISIYLFMASNLYFKKKLMGGIVSKKKSGVTKPTENPKSSSPADPPPPQEASEVKHPEIKLPVIPPIVSNTEPLSIDTPKPVENPTPVKVETSNSEPVQSSTSKPKMSEKIQRAALICIDGWGISPEADPTGDAIRNAKTPVMSGLMETYPNTPVAAHGLSVGLPDGLMGNSEVGHLNIGAGRVVFQDIVRIDLSVRDSKLATLPTVVEAFQKAKSGNGRLHLLGLVSDGGVHSHINHLLKLISDAKDTQIPETYIHFIGDGRDTAPRSASKYYKQLTDYMSELGYGKVADVVGRYYAMDRDKRWERVQVAYEMLVQGKGEVVTDGLAAIEERYTKDETDEFLKPIIVDQEGRVRDEDTLIFFNYRSDRMREITQVFGIPPLPFETDVVPKDLYIATLTQYKADYPFPVVFPAQSMDNVLAEWLSKHNLTQCHVAETEKYAHVTFFFNGGSEVQFPGEQRDLIPSPKVATYDLKPEMSAIEVAEKVAERIDENQFDLVMCNFAPPDMVGHTGIYEKAILGVEATDKAIGIIYEAAKRNGYVLFITSDHGNAEKMLNSGQPHTAHTTAKVPFIMTSKEFSFDPVKSESGALADVAPTILQVMGLPIPGEMTGKSLIT